MVSTSDSSATTRSRSKYKPRQPPSMASTARDGFVCIKYFYNSFNGSWKEAEDKTVTLTDIKPVIFDIFVHWLYTGIFPTDSGELEVIEDGSGDTTDERSDEPLITAMVMVYVFGDRFLAPSLQRAALDHVIAHINFVQLPSWFLATAYAFQNLRENDPILQALIDVHCRYWDAEYYSKLHDRDKKLSELPPATFWIRAMGKLATKETSDEWWSKPLNPCDYHEHANAEERKECSSK